MAKLELVKGKKYVVVTVALGVGERLNKNDELYFSSPSENGQYAVAFQIVNVDNRGVAKTTSDGIHSDIFTAEGNTWASAFGTMAKYARIAEANGYGIIFKYAGMKDQYDAYGEEAVARTSFLRNIEKWGSKKNVKQQEVLKKQGKTPKMSDEVVYACKEIVDVISAYQLSGKTASFNGNAFIMDNVRDSLVCGDCLVELCENDDTNKVFNAAMEMSQNIEVSDEDLAQGSTSGDEGTASVFAQVKDVTSM